MTVGLALDPFTKLHCEIKLGTESIITTADFTDAVCRGTYSLRHLKFANSLTYVIPHFHSSQWR